jgi:probable HAF family extracellular repeat protein
MRYAVRAALPLALAMAAVPLQTRAELPPYRLDWLGEDFYPFAMNDRGQVVGYTAAHRGEGPALLWQDGVTTDLGPGEAHDINNAGRIVMRPYGGGPPAVVREPDGSFTPVNVARAWGGDFRHQYSINDRGQVVGMERIGDVSADGRAFIWDNGTVTYVDPGLPEAPAYAAAHAVNNHGAAAGWWSSTRLNTGGGFVWQAGTVTRLDTPAVSINDAGQVLTLAADVWHEGTTTVLPRLAPLPVSDGESVQLKPAEISNLGQVAGYQWELYLIDVESGYGSIERAFLWDEAGGTRDLNALMGIAPDARNQFALAVPVDVNNVGQIVGYGPRGGWLLTPVPEPGAPIGGLLSASWMSLRRRLLTERPRTRRNCPA